MSNKKMIYDGFKQIWTTETTNLKGQKHDIKIKMLISTNSNLKFTLN